MEASDIYSLVQLGIIGLAVVALVVGTAISGPVLASYWYKARRSEMQLTLKHSMVERGMTAEQICAVMDAGEERKPTAERVPHTANDWKEWANDWKQWAHCWKGRRTRV
jgi:hypothetical protein